MKASSNTSTLLAFIFTIVELIEKHSSLKIGVIKQCYKKITEIQSIRTESVKFIYILCVFSSKLSTKVRKHIKNPCIKPSKYHIHKTNVLQQQ